ncbi:hypothetical protein [Vibrio sp. V33_P6A3T137]|nr:hypothetical protein [Vibrio sp. V33_P6A3T137]
MKKQPEERIKVPEQRSFDTELTQCWRTIRLAGGMSKRPIHNMYL